MRHDGLDAARDLLRNTFGHADFRGLQAGVIGEILADAARSPSCLPAAGRASATRYLHWSGLASVWSSRP
jgi:hypothetical protein